MAPPTSAPASPPTGNVPKRGKPRRFLMIDNQSTPWAPAVIALVALGFLIFLILLFGGSGRNKNDYRKYSQTEVTQPSYQPTYEPLTPSPPRSPPPSSSFVKARPGEDIVKHGRPPSEAAPPENPSVVEIRPPRERKTTFRKPTLKSLATDYGSVMLAWDDDPGTTADLIAGYHVYRRATGAATFTRVTKEPVTKKTYSDDTVEPRKEYEYAVATVTQDAGAIMRLKLPPNGEAQSDPKSVRTAGIFALDLRGVAESPGPPGAPPTPIAQISIRKFVKGNWQTKSVYVKKGERVGSGEFDTGCEVVEIARVAQPRPAAGEIAAEVQTWELRYRDADGAAQKVAMSK
jgi:hypothetical protein